MTGVVAGAFSSATRFRLFFGRSPANEDASDVELSLRRDEIFHAVFEKEHFFVRKHRFFFGVVAVNLQLLSRKTFKNAHLSGLQCWPMKSCVCCLQSNKSRSVGQVCFLCGVKKLPVFFRSKIHRRVVFFTTQRKHKTHRHRVRFFCPTRRSSNTVDPLSFSSPRCGFLFARSVFVRGEKAASSKSGCKSNHR